MIGAAYATREFGAPLAEYMAAYVPKYTGAYSNRKLVEAVAAIAMTDAGVPSPWLDEALRTLNEFVPQWARPTAARRGHRAASSAAPTCRTRSPIRSPTTRCRR